MTASTTPKQATLDLLGRLADDATFEEIQYEIFVLEKIAQGLREVEAGDTVSHAQAREELSRWLGEGRG